MARNRVPLTELVEQHMALRTEQSLDKNTTKRQLTILYRNGLKRLQRSVSTGIKSILITIESGATHFNVPADYLNYTKIGVVDRNGLISVLSVNKNIAIAPEFLVDVNGDILTTADGIQMTGQPVRGDTSISRGWNHVFLNYYYNGNTHNLYGQKSDSNPHGYFTYNEQFNRFEIAEVSETQILLEYNYDPTMVTASDIMVTEQLSDALRKWVIWQAISDKRGITPWQVNNAKEEYRIAVEDAVTDLHPIRVEEIASAWHHHNTQTPKG